MDNQFLQPEREPQPHAAAPPDPLTQLAALLQTLLAGYATGAAQSTPSGALPRGVRAPVPETFDGRRVNDVRPWLNRMRDILSLAGFDLERPEAVRYAASFLTGPAHSWFESERSRAGYGGEESAGFDTFKEFADALAQRMGDPHPEDKARRALRKLRQTTSVKSYADEFQRITSLLPRRDERDLRFDFLSGLKPKIQELLIGKISDDMSWNDVRDLAYRFDDVIMTRWNQQSAYSGLHRSRSTAVYDNRPDDPMDLSTAAVQTSRRRSATPYRGRPSVEPRSPRSTSSVPRLPKLTDELRAELRANNGCFRCRKPNAGHVAANCPGPLSAGTAALRSRSPTPSKN